jgi:lipoprotein-anchoring transpeptidase ErfK/SrfK
MKDGHAIHGSYEVKHLGKPVSHGCVRISPQNAATLYDLVKKNRMASFQANAEVSSYVLVANHPKAGER